MSYGLIVKADDGTLLASSDTPCFKYFSTVSSSSRTGSISTFNVNTTDRPLCFITLGADGFGAGILTISGSSGAWVIQVISTADPLLYVFQKIDGTATGYGAAAYNAAGALVFDSTQPLLNAKALGGLSYGVGAFSSPTANMVSYTSGQVNVNRTNSASYWLLTGSATEFQQETLRGPDFCVTMPNTQYVCSYNSFTYSMDCYYETTYYTTCTPTYYTVFTPVYIDIYTNFTDTSWTLDRAVATRYSSGTSFGLTWINHKSGFYRTINGYYYSSVAFGTHTGIYPGYGFVYSGSFPQYEGEIHDAGSYPYSESINNNIFLPCITALESDYA